MNPRQPISTHLGRFCSVLLPGGYWHLGRLIESRVFAEPCPAGFVAVNAMKTQAMWKHVFVRDLRNA